MASGAVVQGPVPVVGGDEPVQQFAQHVLGAAGLAAVAVHGAVERRDGGVRVEGHRGVDLVEVVAAGRYGAVGEGRLAVLDLDHLARAPQQAVAAPFLQAAQCLGGGEGEDGAVAPVVVAVAVAADAPAEGGGHVTAAGRVSTYRSKVATARARTASGSVSGRRSVRTPGGEMLCAGTNAASSRGASARRKAATVSSCSSASPHSMTAASPVCTSTLISGKDTAEGKVRRVAPPRVTVSPG